LEAVMRRHWILLFVICAFASVAAFADELPDPQKTPGAILDTVPDEQAAGCLSDKTGTSVQVDDPITTALVCTPGYSKCIRNVPQSVKQSVYSSYGLTGNHTGYCDTNQGCEVDHLISIELGGSNDQKNLWPQPYQGTKWNAHVKDQLENWLHKAVCEARMPLDDAQTAIAADWIATYKHNIGDR
jgi:hypothetical protein